MKNHRRIRALALACLLAAGCGDDGPTMPTPIPSGPHVPIPEGCYTLYLPGARGPIVVCDGLE